MTRKATSVLEDINLETFSLVWLGDLLDTEENNISIKKQLRASINHLKTFDDDEQCEQHIRSLAKHDQIVLIVNDQVGQKLIPRIHQLRQVSSIYVHFNDNEQIKEWIQQYPKVNQTKWLVRILLILFLRLKVLICISMI